jgi:esterase
MRRHHLGRRAGDQGERLLIHDHRRRRGALRGGVRPRPRRDRLSVRLHLTEVGHGPPLLVLHGILGQGRNWLGVAKLFADRYRVLAVDLRNHGSSPWGDPMDYPTMAADVAETMEAVGIDCAVLLGHSMGGKVAMVLALTTPGRVRSLVVVDIAPAPYAPENLPFVRAMRSLDLAGMRRRSEADAALRESVPDLRTRAFLLQGLVDAPDGTLAWRHNLEAIERAMPELAGFPAFGAAAAYHAPALFVSGRLSSYVQPEHLAAIAALFPGAETAIIPDAGHWVHADQPAAFAAAVGAFLDRRAPSTSPAPS